MPSFDNRNQFREVGAYQASIATTGTVIDDGIIVDIGDAASISFQLFISKTASSEMDVLQGFFEHSDTSNPADFTPIPADQISGDLSGYTVNLDFQAVKYATGVGAFNTKRFVRTGLEYERTGVGSRVAYTGSIKNGVIQTPQQED